MNKASLPKNGRATIQSKVYHRINWEAGLVKDEKVNNLLQEDKKMYLE